MNAIETICLRYWELRDIANSLQASEVYEARINDFKGRYADDPRGLVLACEAFVKEELG